MKILCLFYCFCLEMTLHFFDASGADALAVEVNDVVDLIAENTGWLVFLQDDLVLVNEDFDRIFLLNI